MVTVAGVGAGVGIAKGEIDGEEGVEPEGNRSTADAAVLVSIAPASATPPAVRNCRLVATGDRM
jgi:hypothetical protein